MKKLEKYFGSVEEAPPQKEILAKAKAEQGSGPAKIYWTFKSNSV